MRKQRRALDSLPPVPHPLRFRAYDGTTRECPAATGADDRLHLGSDWRALRVHASSSSDITTGERLKQYP